jgi:hypothetical protein
MPMPDQKPKLYALLVGVMRYPNLPDDKQLSLPVSDIRLVEKYLKDPMVAAHFEEVCILNLTSPASRAQMELYPGGATKANVVKAFRNHLGEAGKGDVAFFYFSGHGIREKTDVTAFQRAEVDGHIAGIACANFGLPPEHGDSPGKTVLADKEMRYLIRKLAEDENGEPKARVITLFDCCHSGENTKAVGPPPKEARAKQIVRAPIAGRTLEDFIFTEEEKLKIALENGESVDDVLPMASHIMMAACREVELAWEEGRNSVFTKHLIEVLRQHEGAITYQDLHSRVLAKMRYNFDILNDFKDKRQTPQLFVHTENPADRYRHFLTDEPSGVSTTCIVEQAEGEWRINRGFMHHLPMDAEGSGVTLSVHPLKQPDTTVSATIKTVYLTYSVIDFTPPEGAEGPFVGQLDGLGISPMLVHVKGEQADVIKKELQAKLDEAQNPLFAFEEEEAQASYVFEVKDRVGQVSAGATPVLKKVWALNPDQSLKPGMVDTLFAQLNQMAEWTLLKNLHHEPKVDRPKDLDKEAQDYPVELRFYHYDRTTGEERRIYHKDRQFVLDLTEQAPDPDYEIPVAFLRAELVNHSKKELQVSLANMMNNFSFHLTGDYALTDRPVMSIGKAPNNVVDLHGPEEMPNGKTYWPMVVDAYTEMVGLPAAESWAKLIVSRLPYDIAPLAMEGLPTAEEELEEEATGKGGFGRDFNKKTKKQKAPS